MILPNFFFSLFFNLKIKNNFQKLFKNIFLTTKASKKHILLEINNMPSSIIAYAYFCNFLSKKFNAKIHAYRISSNFSFFFQLIFKLRKIFDIIGCLSIYKSFGVSNFFFLNLNFSQKKESFHLLSKIKKKINSKKDFENIIIDNVLIGDLIYDSFLKDYSSPTIEIGSKELENYLKRSIEIYIFWRDYFKSGNVIAIIVSHSVYLNAIPLRIAIKNKIKVFHVTAHSVYSLSKDKLFAYKDFEKYPKIFKKFSILKKNKSLNRAKKRLNSRFKGDVAIDMPYSTKSAYKKKYPFRLINKSNRIKVLVASHCFFDSPHSYGNNLFPDFNEWLNFLGIISLKTNYDWYIKTHPDYNTLTLEVIKKFIKKFNNFTLLPSDTSHNQIIKEGIDYALTIYGTIAVEYAALGICVINGSNNNPHINYKFNINPRSFKEYKKIILSLGNIRFRINKNKVYEYYYMNHLHFKKSWFFEDYNKFEKALGNYNNQFTYKTYKYYLEKHKFNNCKKIFKKIEEFVDSKEYSSIIYYNKYNLT